ncbi:PAS domain-containing protein [Methylobacterium sp. CM6247]
MTLTPSLRSASDEARRLQALESYQIFDTPREEDFDGIATLAAEICSTPIAVVNLIGDGRQFFKAEVGLGVRETPLDTSFCRQAMLQEDFLYVPDATRDPRFEGNPLVTGEPGLRFYAGALLKTPDGHPIGTVCVLDTQPRELTDRQKATLKQLARQTMAQLELRRVAQAQRAQQQLQNQILNSATDYAIIALDRGGNVTRWNEGAHRILGWNEQDMLGKQADVFFTEQDVQDGIPEAEMHSALTEGVGLDERWHLRKDGSLFWASGEMQPLRSEDGSHTGYLKILRDRTAQREQGERLRQSEERLALALGAAGMVGTWDWDLKRDVIFADANFARIYTVDPVDAARGAPLAEYIKNFHPDDMPAFQAELDRLLSGQQEQFSCEYRVKQLDASYRWLLARGRLIRDEAGEAVRFAGASVDITENKLNEQRARESENRYRQLTALAPGIIWEGQPDGSLTYLNDYWYRYTGQTPEEAMPMGWAKVIHLDDLASLEAAWAHSRTHGVQYDTEARLRRHDGTYHWFLIRAVPLRDEQGEIIGWLGNDIDIQERRQAEADLRDAQDQLRLAVEATSIGIFDYNLVVNDLNWDARVHELFGLPPEAPVSYETFLAGLHPEDRNWVDDAVKAALDPAGNGSYDIAYRTMGLQDGVERWVAAKGQAFFAQGRAVRFIGTVRDVTESRRAEQGIRETEERYRLAARATNDAIWDWDLASDHIRWNEAVQTLFGYAADEVGPSGSWWKSHIHPDDQQRIKNSIYAVIDGGTEHWTDEYRFLRADGSYAAIFDRGYVLRDPQGKAVRMIGAMLDISERKRAEEHQRLLTNELQHRVKNTLALVQAIASQTFRNATDIDATREAFAARLISLGRAHDILTQASWTAAPIAEVIEGALSVHQQAGPSRIRISGPNVLLGAKPALSLALALHELATNAVKYGALSNETGFVDLRWHVVHEDEAPRFCLTWSEQGGPPILTQPARRGFGSRLIERSFAAEVGGEVKLTYAPTGLVCRLEASLASMQEQRSEIAA